MMKRYLNLNNFGWYFIRIIGLFLIGLPAVLMLLWFILRYFGYALLGFRTLMAGSLIIGAALAGILASLLILEQIQDRIIVRQYDRSRRKILHNPDGSLECPYCGNRQVNTFEHFCSVCGNELE